MHKGLEGSVIALSGKREQIVSHIRYRMHGGEKVDTDSERFSNIFHHDAKQHAGDDGALSVQTGKDLRDLPGRRIHCRKITHGLLHPVVARIIQASDDVMQ